MKLENLLKIRKVLTDHSKEKIPVQIAYKIMRVLKTTEKEQNFYDDKFKEIISEYSLKDENGDYKTKDGNILIIPSKIKECNAAMEELRNTEVEGIDIKIDLNDISCFQMTVEEMSILEEIIKTEE